MINKSLFIVILLLFLSACNYDIYKYKGSIVPSDHRWLKGRKIFIDPGHGGKGKSDKSRVGPNGITEEEVNLKVALILEDMLRTSGTIVKMSRREDVDIGLGDRIKMVKEFQPELLISIHHNGSPRRVDDINYPCVLFWGNKHIRPASYDFAVFLQKEFHRIMDEKGKVLSDFSVFGETGTKILRESREICPGVIGEAGFFSEKNHSIRLKDLQYNEREAEAYFYAISKYFERGIPSAEVLFSCQIDHNSYLSNMIKTRHPLIAIRTLSGNEKNQIIEKSLKVTLDNIPIKFKKLSDDMFLINYGKTLYPGGHRINFQFKNLRHQSSMILSAPFTVEIKKGDYDRLIKEGRRLLKRKWTAREGLKMLLSALSMGQTEPGADRIILDIARGFRIIGDRANSEYYYKKLYYFYPESPYGKSLKKRILRQNRYRHPVNYPGKKTIIKGAFKIKE